MRQSAKRSQLVSGYVRVLVSNVAILQRSRQGEVCAALAAKVGAKDGLARDYLSY